MMPSVSHEAETKSQALDQVLAWRGPRILAVWQGGSSSVALPEREITLTVGRSKNSDVRIDDASVSRTHVKLHICAPAANDERAIVVEDQGSSNGTRINGRRMDPKASSRVVPGDVVEMGSAVLVVQRFGDVAPPSDAFRPPSDRPAAPNGPVALSSAPMQRFYRTLNLVARSRINALIIGETGVGKDVAARAIHERSPRAGAPFVAINCASMPETLLESELLGFERGAFTGADRSKKGLVEAASGGTLFLDELGELPLGVQAKLLRIIEVGEVRRLGSLDQRAVDVRFIAATNRPLQSMVDAGSFRRDLYYRINGISLHIPPLREHVEDIEPLARWFVARASQESGLMAPLLSRAALAALRAHGWPGNIRELRNVMERALVLSQGETIDVGHLALQIADPVPEWSADPPVLRDQLANFERERIVAALEQTGGNQSRAAELLGMSRRTLVKRIGEYALPRPRKGRSS
jgi:DNA-binding NtrC family response regulator